MAFNLKNRTPALMASWATWREALGHGGHLPAGDVVHRVGTGRDQVSLIP